jgi:hypothetical protein
MKFKHIQLSKFSFHTLPASSYVFHIYNEVLLGY